MSTLIAVAVAVAWFLALLKLGSARNRENRLQERLAQTRCELETMTDNRDSWRNTANERRDIIAELHADIQGLENALSLAIEGPQEPTETPFDAPQFHEAAAPTGELLPSQWLGSADEMTVVPIGCAAVDVKAGNGNQS